MADLFAPTVARTQSAYAAAGKPYTLADAKKDANEVKNNSGYLKTSSNDNLSLTMQQFLQLMIVQFQNQDMDNPASTSDMMNQLMQMSTIQAMATMTDASTMSYAASLVGKTVTVGEYTKSGLKEIVGVVTGTGTYDGDQVIFINGKSYKLSSIMAVGEIPKEDKPEKPEGGGSTGGTEKPEGGGSTGGTEKPEGGGSTGGTEKPEGGGSTGGTEKPEGGGSTGGTEKPEGSGSTGDSQTGSDTAGGTDNKTESGEG